MRASAQVVYEGQNAKAEPMLIRAAAISEKVFGPDYPELANTLSALAGLWRDSAPEGRPQSA